jgi:hypothetical protein
MGPSGDSVPRPTHLFASQIAPQSSSRRPQQTLQPLAQSLRLPIDTSVPKADIGRLALAILAVEGVVLVAWEHHLIPSLAAALTGQPPLTPDTWPDDRFDVVWVLERDADQAPFQFREVFQRVLAGDSDPAMAAAAAGPEPA